MVPPPRLAKVAINPAMVADSAVGTKETLGVVIEAHSTGNGFPFSHA